MINRTIIDHKFQLGQVVFTSLKGMIIPFKIDAIMFVVDDIGAKTVYGHKELYLSEEKLFEKAEEVKA